MKKHVAIFAAVALALGSLGFAEQPGEARQDAQRELTQPMERPTGIHADRADLPTGTIRSPEEADQGQIKQAVAETVEAALQAGDEGFDGLLERLAQNDRERLEQQLREVDRQELEQHASALRESFRERFDQDLELEAEQALPEEVQIAQGEVISPAVLIRWPVEPAEDRDRDQLRLDIDRPQPQHDRMDGLQDRLPGESGAGAQPQQQPGVTDREPGQQPGQPGVAEPQPGQPGVAEPQPGEITTPGQPERPSPRIGDEADRIGMNGLTAHGLEAGDQIAVVTLPEMQDLPEVKISLVQEDGQWKLALPREVDAQAIQQNLASSLQELEQQKDQWPEEAEKAQRYISQKVLMALYDVDAEQEADRPGMPMDRPGTQPGAQF